MVLGVGCDIVAVNRFAAWDQHDQNRLSAVFASEEIAEYYLLSGPTKAQYLASRFAVKEAFYKAFCSLLVSIEHAGHYPGFASVRRHSRLDKSEHGIPHAVINWQALEELVGNTLPVCKVEVSLAHEALHALAFVIIQKL